MSFFINYNMMRASLTPPRTAFQRIRVLHFRGDDKVRSGKRDTARHDARDVLKIGVVREDPLHGFRTVCAATPENNKKPPIYGQVDRDRRQSQNVLHLAGECGRVQCGQDIVFDKSPRIPGLPAPEAQMVFQQCKRAYPSSQFNGNAPHGRGYLNPEDPAPPQGQGASESGKQNESAVNEYNDVG